MKNRHLPNWLLILFGLSAYTPRGLAARYAESAHRGRVLKPLFDGTHPAPNLPEPPSPAQPQEAPPTVADADADADAAAAAPIRHAA